MRDSYTNRKHCPSHEMWSYERDGRWRGWSFVRGSTVSQNAQFGSKWGLSIRTTTHLATMISSVVECRNQVSPGSNPPFATVSKIGHFRSIHDAPVDSAV